MIAIVQCATKADVKSVVLITSFIQQGLMLAYALLILIAIQTRKSRGG